MNTEMLKSIIKKDIEYGRKYDIGRKQAGNNEFKSWVSQLKKDIRSAQIKAAIKVNTELLRLY